MQTRRAFFLFTAPAALAQSLADPRASSEIGSSEQDTWIRLISDEDPDVFFVGVRTSIEARYALVTVFYNVKSTFGKLLLSKESMAPVAGIRGYGGTRGSFSIPREALQSIEVLFLNEVADRRFK